MYQFFVKEDQVADGQIRITGADYNHIRNALRMVPGEQLRISTEGGRTYLARLDGYEEACAVAVIEEEDTVGTELPVHVVLFQGLPKADRMELVVQKSTELGVSEIVPVTMRRCIMKLDPRKAESRIGRWQAIAESAAKQSKRTRIPQIHLPMGWQEALSYVQSLDALLVPYENEHGMDGTRAAIGSITPGQTVGILIGPEGGFDPEEVASLPADAHRISLGRRILRTETAGPAMLAMLIYALEQ